MKTLNNMLWMLSGVGVGILGSKYAKSMKKKINKTVNSIK